MLCTSFRAFFFFFFVCSICAGVRQFQHSNQSEIWKTWNNYVHKSIDLMPSIILSTMFTVKMSKSSLAKCSVMILIGHLIHYIVNCTECSNVLDDLFSIFQTKFYWTINDNDLFSYSMKAFGQRCN